MKIKLTNGDMVKALRAVGKVIERSHALPLLKEILCEVSGGKMLVTGSNLQMEVSVDLSVEAEGDTKFTLAADKASAICGTWSASDELTIERSGDTRSIFRCGRSKQTIPGLIADDYPRIGTEADIGQFHVKNMVSTMGTVVPAAPTNDVRYYLNGVCLRIKDKRVDLLGACGTEIARNTLEIDADMAVDAILPGRSVSIFSSIFSNEEISIILKNNLVIAAQGGTTALMKTIDGRYPDVAGQLSREPAGTIQLSRAQLMGALSRMAVMSENVRDSSVFFQWNGEALEILPMDSLKNNREVVDAKTTGEIPRLYFPSRKILKVLAHSPDVELEISNEVHGILTINQDTYRCAVSGVV